MSTYCLPILLAAVLSATPALAQDSYRVALDGTLAPHAMPKLDGGVEGFNVDLAQLIAERLGADITIDAAQFSASSPRCRPALMISLSPRSR